MKLRDETNGTEFWPEATYCVLASKDVEGGFVTRGVHEDGSMLHVMCAGGYVDCLHLQSHVRPRGRYFFVIHHCCHLHLPIIPARHLCRHHSSVVVFAYGLEL